MSRLVVHGVRARYGSREVLAGVDLAVEPDSIVSVLGPSGCGKTTLLRTIAGHHRITHGSIEIDGVPVASARTHTAPERRNMTVVPQEGGLFPHLDVSRNIGFGLRGHDNRGQRIERMLELIGLSGLGDRRPHQLSGGQQQRVAVGRALAPQPAFVLLDEPFSALDAQLREGLRTEVKALLRVEEATAILVTHDQAEALALGDSVALMRDGRIVQQGPPMAVYHRPVDVRAARFLGESLILPAGRAADGRVETPLGSVAVDGRGRHVLLRPDQLVIGADGYDVKVRLVEFRGAYSKVTGDLSDGTSVVVHTPVPVREAEMIRVRVAGRGWLLDD